MKFRSQQSLELSCFCSRIFFFTKPELSNSSLPNVVRLQPASALARILSNEMEAAVPWHLEAIVSHSFTRLGTTVATWTSIRFGFLKKFTHSQTNHRNELPVFTCFF